MPEFILLFSVCKLKKIEMLKYALVGALVVVLLASSYFGIYYYNSSKALTGRIQGATLEAAMGFHFSLYYATTILKSEAEPENIDALIRYFSDHVHSAIYFLRALRMYLLSSYEDSLLIIEDLLLRNIWAVGSVYDTFTSITNVSLRIDAFKELNLVASEKIDEMGHELAEAFESLRSDHIVQTFEIDPSRIENAVIIANDLKTILNQWITRYSQM
jgi:hypothetical protein